MSDENNLWYVRQQLDRWKAGVRLPIDGSAVVLGSISFAVIALGLSWITTNGDLGLLRHMMNVGVGFVPALVLRARHGRNMPFEAAGVGVAIAVLALAFRIPHPGPPWSFAGSAWKMALAAFFCGGVAAAVARMAARLDAGGEGVVLVVGAVGYLVYVGLAAPSVFTDDDDGEWIIHALVFMGFLMFVTTGFPESGDSD
jgi:hypothetical protein